MLPSTARLRTGKTEPENESAATCGWSPALTRSSQCFSSQGAEPRFFQVVGIHQSSSVPFTVRNYVRFTFSIFLYTVHLSAIAALTALPSPTLALRIVQSEEPSPRCAM